MLNIIGFSCRKVKVLTKNEKTGGINVICGVLRFTSTGFVAVKGRTLSPSITLPMYKPHKRSINGYLLYHTPLLLFSHPDSFPALFPQKVIQRVIFCKIGFEVFAIDVDITLNHTLVAVS